MAARAPTTRIRAAGQRAERMARLQWLLGVGITVVIVVAQWFDLFHWTSRVEYPFLDARARHFTFFEDHPSDEIALIAIDDMALDTIGKWPWPRSRIAAVIRELNRAGAKVIALDLLLDDPEVPRLEGDPARPESIKRADGDAELAAAIREHGNVVLGASFQIRTDGATRRDDQRWSDEKTAEKIAYPRVFDAVSENPGITFEELRAKLVTGKDAAAAGGATIDDLRIKFDWARTIVDRQFEFSIPGATSPIEVPLSDDPEPPAPALLTATKQLASVSFGREDLDGGVRRVPLWIRSGARLYPTLGLAAAARQMGVDIADIRIEGRYTLIPQPGGSTRAILMHRAPLRRLGDVQGLAYVGWPRGGNWQSQFEAEAGSVRSAGEIAEAAARRSLPEAAVRKEMVEREIPIGRILEPLLVADKIAANIDSLDAQMLALGALYGFIDEKTYAPRAAELSSLDPHDPRWPERFAPQRAAWENAAKEAAELIESFAGAGADELSAEEQAQLSDLRRVVEGVPRTIEEITSGLARVKQWREEDLPKRVAKKLCLIGWSATGALADFVQTSIDARTPGMHVHAAVMNSILTSKELEIGTSYLRWIDALAVLALGILATLIGVRLPVLLGPLALAGLMLAWGAINGVLFWDSAMQVVAGGTPFAAAGISWLVVILHRLLVEQRGRRQTEARFRSYVSPDVVDILVNNPSLSSMEPQKRELTMLFSDIAGFTTISERLSTEQLATMLNTYLGATTDILQRNQGTIDKYLGDGIMVFWGAPVVDKDHALHAATAAVQMLEKLDQMNAAGAFAEAGPLHTRIGIATGEVNVGDFGNPPHKSAYTVIGDAVNSAARLESANKYFGTQILITDRVKKLMGDRLRTRLIGRIVVKGKTDYQTLYELIGTRNPKSDRTNEWISRTDDAVGAYIRGDFSDALAQMEQLEREFADSLLAGVYRRSIESILSQGGVPSGFAGTIVLSEK